jgi:hypothetical protein
MLTVFVLDLDGTIVGNVATQAFMFDLVQKLKTVHCKIKLDKTELQHKLKNGLVRPYFDRFIAVVKKYNPETEFFVYTASAKPWANYLIKNIEQAFHIEFNRPIFTRDQCVYFDGEYKKSIHKVMPMIAKSLKKKLGTHDLKYKIHMIDNTNVFPKSEQPLLLLCPTYRWQVPENIPVIITQKIYEKHPSIIIPVLRRFLNISENATYTDFQRVYYTWYVSILQLNPHHDQYFRGLTEKILAASKSI